MSCVTPRRMSAITVVAIAVLTCGVFSARAENWPRFRGENGSGVSPLKGIPATWSTGDYAWNIELPGIGHSSPCIWGQKIFVSSAIDEGRVRYLLCINTKSGKQIWSKLTGFNRSRKHKKSSWASASPTTDGERVYVAFADQEHYILAAYDFDGNLEWRRNIGPFESRHGQGCSPIIFEDMVIIANDQNGPSSVVAFNRKTGQLVWSTLRTSRRVSYASPIIVRKKGKQPQLIVSCGAMGVTSLDPHTGRLNWMTGELPARTVASPIFADGLVIQPCGGGGVGKFLVAVNPFANEKGLENRIVYTRKQKLPYVPTPVVHEKHLYLWNDNGVVSCVETATGKNIWTKRVPGAGTYSGSPVCVDGRLYIMSEKGDVVVLNAAPQYRFHGRMPLGDPSHSTPAVGDGRLFFRTYHRLACLRAVR